MKCKYSYILVLSQGFGFEERLTERLSQKPNVRSFAFTSAECVKLKSGQGISFQSRFSR